MKVKILIIEDSEQDQKIIRRHLLKNGYDKLSICDSGEKGLQELPNFKPDIVVTDTNLPGMSGFDVCQKVRSSADFDGRIIVMTGAIDAVDAGKARQQGADDYCVKTADCGPLLQALTNVQKG